MATHDAALTRCAVLSLRTVVEGVMTFLDWLERLRLTDSHAARVLVLARLLDWVTAQLASVCRSHEIVNALEAAARRVVDGQHIERRRH